MPVGAAPAKAKLDFRAGGEARQGRSRVGDPAAKDRRRASRAAAPAPWPRSAAPRDHL
ncbi:MAG TPA: hypothetical protein VNO69_03840 [Methyloceanibacter sp.]|nr:hypothetical protein [Methyloceanibacter sp.]